MKLYEPLITAVDYGGRQYTLEPWFDRVLRVYDVQSDKGFTDSERLDISLSLLVRGKYPHDARLYELIFDRLIKTEQRGGSSTRSVDFVQDAPYIYAAFRQAYNLNLISEQGRLHWQEFVALFSSLPGDTRMMEIIGIRTRKLPKPNISNAEERAEIMRLKSIYALDISAEEREANMQDGLRKMVMSLQSMAGGGK